MHGRVFLFAAERAAFHVPMLLVPLLLLLELLLRLLELLDSLDASDGAWVEQSSSSGDESSFKHASDKHLRRIGIEEGSNATTPLPRRRALAIGPMDEVGSGVVFTIMGSGDNRAVDVHPRLCCTSMGRAPPSLRAARAASP